MAEKVKGSRVATIRIRTWALTLAIIVALIFYLLASITTKDGIDIIDFIFKATIQIVVFFLYFPDGELFGQRNPVFVANRQAYNDRAGDINQNERIARLREYCKTEYEERKKRYILSECGAMDITLDELDTLKTLSAKEVRNLETYEIKNPENPKKSKMLFFTRAKRKRLYNLLFKPLPIEENHPETIMCAVERDSSKAIKDGSVFFRKGTYIRKVVQATVVAGFLAYIGYTLKDGIGLPEVISIFIYLTTIFTTAVMAFSAGEKCSKVYKSEFYVELINFIDAFNEWDNHIEETEDTNVQPPLLESISLIESSSSEE